MRRLILFALGLLPIGIGKYYGNLMIVTNMDGSKMILFTLAFLTLWFVVGIVSRKYSSSLIEATLLTHLVGLFSFIVLMMQFVVRGRFMGPLAQAYFLPALRLASEIEMKLFFFLKVHTIMPIYFIGLALMILVYNLGFKVAENRR